MASFARIDGASGQYIGGGKKREEKVSGEEKGEEKVSGTNSNVGKTKNHENNGS
jgi:hypothetical protein